MIVVNTLLSINRDSQFSEYGTKLFIVCSLYPCCFSIFSTTSTSTTTQKKEKERDWSWCGRGFEKRCVKCGHNVIKKPLESIEFKLHVIICMLCMLIHVSHCLSSSKVHAISNFFPDFHLWMSCVPCAAIQVPPVMFIAWCNFYSLHMLFNCPSLTF